MGTTSHEGGSVGPASGDTGVERPQLASPEGQAFDLCSKMGISRIQRFFSLT